MKGSAPGKAWARRMDDIGNLKPCTETQRGGSKPRPEKLATAGTESCVGKGDRLCEA